MLTVTSPTGGSTLPSAGFQVSGTCSSDHQVTVKLTMTSTGQFHEYFTQASMGSWSKTVTPWGAGPYRITVTCEGMADSITVDFGVSMPQISTDPPLGP